IIFQVHAVLVPAVEDQAADGGGGVLDPQPSGRAGAAVGTAGAVQLDPVDGIVTQPRTVAVGTGPDLREAIDDQETRDPRQGAVRPDRPPAVGPVGVDVGDGAVVGRGGGRDVGLADPAGDAVVPVVDVAGVRGGDGEDDAELAASGKAVGVED